MVLRVGSAVLIVGDPSQYRKGYGELIYCKNPKTFTFTRRHNTPVRNWKRSVNYLVPQENLKSDLDALD